MVKICEQVCTYHMNDFLRFAAAIKVEYKHIFELINNLYRRETGRDLPTPQEADSDTNMASSQQPLSSSQATETSSSHINEPAAANIPHSNEVSGSETLRQSNSSLCGENSVSNGASPDIDYRSLGPAVPCPSDETFQQENAGVHNNLPQGSDFQDPPSLKKYDRIMRDNPAKIYTMESLPRGYCLIINNEEFQYLNPRAGSHEDFVNLNKMFKFLGFKVSAHMNQTGKQMKDLMRECANMRCLEQMSALAVVILSHGGVHDCIFGYDGDLTENGPVPNTVVYRSDLLQIFKGTKCVHMNGKPKLFILQACRGDEEDLHNANQDDSSSETDDLHRDNHDVSDDVSSSQSSGSDPSETSSQNNTALAETAEMFFLHSSSLGYKAYRSKLTGSPFVRHFTETVIRDAHEKHLYKIVMEVQNKFSRKMIGRDRMTMPEYSSLLTKKWYFNPPV